MSCTTVFALEGIKAIFFLVLTKKQGHRGAYLFIYSFVSVKAFKHFRYLPSFHHRTAANMMALTVAAAATFRSG